MSKPHRKTLIVATTVLSATGWFTCVLRDHVMWDGVIPTTKDSCRNAWIMVCPDRTPWVIRVPPLLRLLDRIFPPPPAIKADYIVSVRVEYKSVRLYYDAQLRAG
jgi:hypothetical protein